MNILLLVAGAFVSIEGYANVLFYRFRKDYDSKARSSRVLFQVGRTVRILAGLIAVYYALI